MHMCEYCGKGHDGSYGSGRFCSPTCSRKFSNQYVTEEGRQRQTAALTNPETRKKINETRKQRSKELTQRKKNSVVWPNVPNKDPTKSMQIGKLGEIAVAKKFLEHGISVYAPLVDRAGADLIADFGDCGGLKKIQVKASSRKTPSGATAFITSGQRLKYSHGSYSTYTRGYTKDEVDYFGLYDITDDEVYLVENTGAFTNINIRTTAPKNKMTKGVNFAEDYRIDRILDELGHFKDVIETDQFSISDSDEDIIDEMD